LDLTVNLSNKGNVTNRKQKEKEKQMEALVKSNTRNIKNKIAT
jgi:hypothetical protein